MYPLYGAIDIRNSSIERNQAIQQDMLEQLHMADEIVRQAQKSPSFHYWMRSVISSINIPIR